MFNQHKYIKLCDITSSQDDTTGDRTITVSNKMLIVGTCDLVGVQTQMLAQSQNMTFNYSIEIDRMFYKEQKYLYMNSNVYEIKGLGKGSKPHLMKLNLVQNNDNDIRTAIENANL